MSILLSPLLPPAFQLSQSSLQDFADCARRFQLRYLMEQDWPAPIAEPIGDAERADILGKQFHLLMERHFLGLPTEKIAPNMLSWWEAFLQTPVPNLPAGQRKPEISTSAVIQGQRMVAAFDLLAYDPGGEAIIVDWKTTRRRSSRAWLDRRLQTIIYPLLLVESSQSLIGYRIKPEQIKLIYWFANASVDAEHFEVFQYSSARLEQDRQTLAILLDNLNKLFFTAGDVWPLTANLNLCKLCRYRSLCDRGREAGVYDEIEHDEPFPPDAPH